MKKFLILFVFLFPAFANAKVQSTCKSFCEEEEEDQPECEENCSGTELYNCKSGCWGKGPQPKCEEHCDGTELYSCKNSCYGSGHQAPPQAPLRSHEYTSLIIGGTLVVATMGLTAYSMYLRFHDKPTQEAIAPAQNVIAVVKDTDCGICLSKAEIPVYLHRNHGPFCLACITEWFETAPARTCPLCREEI